MATIVPGFGQTKPAFEVATIKPVAAFTVENVAAEMESVRRGIFFSPGRVEYTHLRLNHSGIQDFPHSSGESRSATRPGDDDKVHQILQPYPRRERVCVLWPPSNVMTII